MSRIQSREPRSAPPTSKAPEKSGRAAPQQQASPQAVKQGWVAAASAKSSDTAASATKAAGDFYAAFSRRDAAGMARAYDKNVSFHDPLFGTLNGQHEVMEMWKTIMPAANPKTFKIEPTVQRNPTQRPDGSFEVKVHWDAHYDLGNRHIDNHSDTTLIIKNGKIISQRDDWDLGKWTKQALPFGGGTALGNAFVGFAAHSFIEVKDMLDRGSWR